MKLTSIANLHEQAHNYRLQDLCTSDILQLADELNPYKQDELPKRTDFEKYDNGVPDSDKDALIDSLFARLSIQADMIDNLNNAVIQAKSTCKDIVTTLEKKQHLIKELIDTIDNLDF